MRCGGLDGDLHTLGCSFKRSPEIWDVGLMLPKAKDREYDMDNDAVWKSVKVAKSHEIGHRI